VEISTAKMMTQHEIIRERIKAYEIGSSFSLLGFMFDSMDATRDSDPNHYQICYLQAQKLHTSLVNSLQSFESTILSFNPHSAGYSRQKIIFTRGHAKKLQNK
jgi:hypothetical protein